MLREHGDFGIEVSLPTGPVRNGRNEPREAETPTISSHVSCPAAP